MRTTGLLIIALIASNLFFAYKLYFSNDDMEPPTSLTKTAASTNIKSASKQENNATAQNVDLAAERTVQRKTKNAVSPSTDSTIIAYINDHPVHQRQLLPYLYDTLPEDSSLPAFSDLPEQVRNQALKTFALDLVLEQQAQASGINKNIRVQANIERSRRKLLGAAYLDQLAPRLISNEQVENEYHRLAGKLKGRQEHRIQHILLADEKEAQIIYDALQQKARSFEDLARLFSLDEATSHKGGDLGYQLTENLTSAFRLQINSLQTGDYSKPFQTEAGWHIIKLNETRKARIASFEQAAPVLRKKLQTRATKAHVEKLLRQTRITLAGASSGKSPTAAANSQNIHNRPE